MVLAVHWSWKYTGPGSIYVNLLAVGNARIPGYNGFKFVSYHVSHTINYFKLSTDQSCNCAAHLRYRIYEIGMAGYVIYTFILTCGIIPMGTFIEPLT